MVSVQQQTTSAQHTGMRADIYVHSYFLCTYTVYLNQRNLKRIQDRSSLRVMCRCVNSYISYSFLQLTNALSHMMWASNHFFEVHKTQIRKILRLIPFLLICTVLWCAIPQIANPKISTKYSTSRSQHRIKSHIFKTILFYPNYLNNSVKCCFC